MRKPVVVVSVIICLLSLTPILGAQANSCKAHVTCAIYSLYDGRCLPLLPPGAYNCQTTGPWSAMCDIPTYQCSAAPCPTCNGAKGGGPIDLASGNTDISEADVRLPGLGGGLTLSRTWNSQNPAIGMFGLGWTSNVEEKVYLGADNLVKQLRQDGSVWSFGFSSYGTDSNTSIFLLAGPKNGNIMAQVDASKWTFVQKSGEQKTFDRATGVPLSSTDRNGNTTTFSYDTANRLVTMTDPASRHLYFSYTTYMVGGLSVSLVTGVSSDFGTSLSYQYDTAGRLVKVTKPDNTFVTFEYDSANFITAVKDSDGKVLEAHTYDTQGRGLTSSKAGGVEGITVSY
jgi:YD repeat-containing protein